MDLFDIIEKEKREFLLEDIMKDRVTKEDLYNRLVEFYITSMGKSLPGYWKKLSRDMLKRVIDFILSYYLEKGLRLSLIQGLILFHKDFRWIEKAKDFIIKNELLSKRSHMFSDALEAHLEGKYNFSIPLLLMQFRGLLYSVCKTPRIMKMDSLPSGKSHVKITGLCINIPVNLKDMYMDDLCAEILRDIDLFTHDMQKEVFSGHNLNFGTDENSTQLVMFLHMLLIALGMEGNYK